MCRVLRCLLGLLRVLSVQGFECFGFSVFRVWSVLGLGHPPGGRLSRV